MRWRRAQPWPGADRDALARCRGFRAGRNCKSLGTLSDRACPDRAERRRCDHAGDRRAVINQRDIDRVFGHAGDEFARAVERVDQQERVSAHRQCDPGERFSETTGVPGSSRERPWRMTTSDASSAAVTGDWSILSRRDRSAGLTARIAAAAWEAIETSPSSRRRSIEGRRNSESCVTRAPRVDSRCDL